MQKIWVNDHDRGKVPMSPGQNVLVVAMPYSEICMHMGVAGKKMECELLYRENGQCRAVQLRNPETKQLFSSPILPGEAGFYQTEDEVWYGYFPKEITT